VWLFRRGDDAGVDEGIEYPNGDPFRPIRRASIADSMPPALLGISDPAEARSLINAYLPALDGRGDRSGADGMTAGTPTAASKSPPRLGVRFRSDRDGKCNAISPRRCAPCSRASSSEAPISTELYNQGDKVFKRKAS